MDKIQNCDKCMLAGICKFEEKARDYEKSLNEVEAPLDILEVRVYCNKIRLKREYWNTKKGVNKTS